MFETFNQESLHQICNRLAQIDGDLKLILDRYGYPPFWSRPNTFESLVHIILEQQVSLASALATLNKLKEKIKIITPEKLLGLNDEELRNCYFSRQKTVYVRDLAEKLLTGKLSLKSLESMDDYQIRQQLKSVKGIGDWTVDIYLIFILHHSDVFPIGDLAAVNALKQVKKLDKNISRDEIVEKVSEQKPYRTIYTMILWHYYLEQRKTPNKEKLLF
ncbi:DNA-3-methyladenine glycosylase family protein [Pedobacter paludis]|uniref:DNA-3-methyladenine glycosylase II n=1 Tax=Pedobacter paludis TaxID=2203212 RepID=A0A317ETM7_9SPHI|nr:DNA-3-methyladenine glycosylase [Pedobacter paludis]PWS30044.1 DNA-3-methyladenine glycosylase 2 family protein [Pedobacter paludis]